MTVAARRVLVCLIAFVLLSGGALAQKKEREPGWSNKTDLSYVVTDGNAEAETFGFGNVTKKFWKKGEARLRLDAVRSDTSDDWFTIVEPGLVFDIGGEPPTGFDTILIKPSAEPDVEKYFAEGRYDRDITKKLQWHAGLSWDRDEDAGIKNRYIAFAGVGNTWFNRDDRVFKTSYGFSYTDRDEETPDPEKDDTFAGGRLSWDFMDKWGENTTFDSDLITNVNLSDTSDYNVNFTNGGVGLDELAPQAEGQPAVALRQRAGARENVDQFARVELLNDDEYITVRERRHRGRDRRGVGAQGRPGHDLPDVPGYRLLRSPAASTHWARKASRTASAAISLASRPGWLSSRLAHSFCFGRVPA